MSRTTRALLCALCLLTFGLAAAPAFAQAPPGLFATIFRGFIVTVVGAGETEAEALDNALDRLREDYFVLSYTVKSSFCSEVELPGTHDTITLCAVEVEARVIRKFTSITPPWP